MLAPAAAHATHFRYGTINWQPIGGNKIRFHVQNAWRRNADPCYNVTTNAAIPCTGTGGLPGFGDIIRENTGTTRFDFGDSTSVGSNGSNPLYYRVSSIDVTNNWIFGDALDGNKLPAVDTNIDHTYASTGTFTAGIDTCCRISAVLAPNEHINNPDVSYRVQTTVTVGGVGNSSPVSNQIPIVTCFINSVCTFFVPASDPNGNTLHWSLATSIQASSSATDFTQPGPPDSTFAASINPTTGLYTWNTAGATLASNPSNHTLYSTQVLVDDGINRIPVDFLIELIPKVDHAPTFTSPTCGATQTVAAGSNLSYTVTASDADVGDSVTLTVAGLPAGAIQSPSLPTVGNPVSSGFSWTPGAGDVGTHVLVYAATDGDGQQVQCSTTIVVTCTLALCGDGNVCTTDTCSPTGCVHTPISGGSCDDNNACTSGDTCSAGTCIGTTISCNDNNSCTDDTCVPATGCVHTNDDTNACTDNNACTTGDHCSQGSCVGGLPLNCDDGNGCTDDGCNPASGCTHSNNTDPCSDGNACTSNDHCAGGSCAGGPAVVCNDGNLCTTDTCDPGSGCVFTNNSLPCSDGSFCTTNDTCSGGSCVGGPAPNCDDGNDCTDDTCVPATGCVNTNNTATCDDGNLCTTGDHCGGGSCHGGPALVCDDGNVCTSDTCVPATGCVFTNNTIPCSTGNPCTTNQVCSGGMCSGGTAVSCDDLNPCTTDSCSPTSGCQHVNNTASCDDGNACTTNDTCGGGTCHGGVAPDCNDGNPCTSDGCDSASGCFFNNNTLPCNDGDACTTSDHCVDGSCVGGPAPNCDDNDVCTSDTCSHTLGCQHTNNTDPCDDGSLCTFGDHCLNDSCVGTPVDCTDNNVCTDDGCIPATGCFHNNNTASCNDGSACTTGDTCGGGSCHGAFIDCDDHNGCTDDGCNPQSGCTHLNNTVACDDGSACTTADHCSGGSCHGGPAPNCDDGNPCTDDSCPGAGGCVHTNNTAPCDDHDVCTANDHCAGGGCVGGAPPTCSDNNACTRDFCDPLIGCAHTLDACDDGNICTDDTCDPLNGCVHTPNMNPCDDGNRCTQFDHCVAGECNGGPALFAEKTLKLNNGFDATTSVGANDPKSIVRLSKNITMPDGTYVLGNTVTIGNEVSAFDVFGNKIKVASRGLIRGSQATATLPFTNEFCVLPENTPPCNPGAPVSVPNAGSVGPLAPGIYGDVSVGQGGTLILGPSGTYVFCSIKTLKHVGIQVNGPGQSIINVSGSVKIADDSTLGPSGGPPPILNVGGNLVRLGAGAHVIASIVAPNATFRLGRRSILDGPFCSAKITSDKGVETICTP